MTELSHLLKAGINVRSFRPDPIPDDILQGILDAGKLASSRDGVQPWRFFVPQGEELKKELGSAALNQEPVRTAPVLIVVCADLDLAEERLGKRGREFDGIVAAGAACQNMVVAAREKSLSATWIASFHERRVARLLGIDVYELLPVAILAIGYSDESGERLETGSDTEVVVRVKERQDIVRRL